MAEESTPKRRSRGHSTSASLGEGLRVHIGLWERSLGAANRSAETVQVYLEWARQHRSRHGISGRWGGRCRLRQLPLPPEVPTDALRPPDGSDRPEGGSP